MLLISFENDSFEEKKIIIKLLIIIIIASWTKNVDDKWDLRKYLSVLRPHPYTNTVVVPA